MDADREARRFASAVGRRSEAQYFDLEVDDLECEQAEILERIEELKEETNSTSYVGSSITGIFQFR
jgi:hypothetical protein